MREWVAVTLTAAASGVVGTILSQGLRYAGKWNTVTDYRKWFTDLLPPALINMLGGGVASFILWGTYTSSFNFNSNAYTPSEAVAAIIVGLGGASALTRYLQVEEKMAEQAHEARDWKAARDESLDAFQEVSALIDQDRPKEHTEGGGQQR